MEFITPLLQVDFREYCVGNMVLRQIHDVFTMAGIKKGNLSQERANILSGQRRTLVEEYYSAINWQSEADAEKLLKVIGYAIAQADADKRKNLQALCEREGYVVDGTRIFKQSTKPIKKPVNISSEKLAEFQQRLVEISKLESQAKGFAFEKFLNDLFDTHDLAPRGSFRL